MIRMTVWLLFASVALAQDTPPAFEVASIKISDRGEMVDILGASFDAWMRGGPGSNDPGRISFTNASLRSMIMSAYEVKRYQISGPLWLATAYFNVLATVPPGASKEQVKLMLQNLLAERFKLALHREKRELPVYNLVVAKNGPKMKVSQSDPEAGGGSFGPWNGHARWITPYQAMRGLAEFLSPRLNRPVMDATGLTGKYDFTLYWDSENMDARLRQPTERNSGPEAMEPAPNIFSALQQQLGLRLEQSKSMMDILVIDRAEKIPTEN